MNCPACNSKNILEGFLSSHYGVTFTEKGTENKLRPNAYKIEAKACRDCGQLFDLCIILKER